MNNRKTIPALAAVLFLAAGCAKGDPVDSATTVALSPSPTASSSIDVVTPPPESPAPANGTPGTAAPTTKSTATAAQGAPGTTKGNNTSPRKGGEATALMTLATLKIAAPGPMTGYNRDSFPHWLDVDGDGCNADDQAVKLHANVELKNKCREVAGTMVDPYSGETLSWGASRAGKVDIDHIVALGNVWISGGKSMSHDQRTAIANDQLNLLPVSASLNRQKSDQDASTWVPPLKSFQCQYVARQIAVKSRYGLTVTAGEYSKMKSVLSTCPDEALPTNPTVIVVPGAVEKPSPKTAPRATTLPKKATAPRAPVTNGGSGSKKTDPKFSSCKEAKAKGYGPYKRGDAEYKWYRDGDGDGTVCE